MANPVVNGGLRLFRQKQAQELEIVIIPSSDSSNTFMGDAVKQLSGAAKAIGQGPLAMAVQVCTAVDAIYGTVQGFLPQFIDGTAAMNLGQLYRSASTDMYAVIRRANNEDEYVISDDGTSIGAAGIGKNTNLVCTAGSITGNQLSAFTANHSTGTSATYQLKIIGKLDIPNNDTTLGNAQYIVRINNAQTSGGTGTLGV